MIKLGITGGIGSGKSTISEIFSLCDIPVYIADIESKRLIATSPIIKEKLIKMFGPDLFENNVLNKSLLATHIFNDRDKLNAVNAIIHPEVEKDFREWVTQHSRYKIVAHEAAILFESGFDKLMDKVVMVYSPLEVRIARTMNRDNISREKVLERIENQMSDEDKIKLSDFIIVNDGEQSLIEQVQAILEQLKK
ncbi:dephospho-CoA kinase [Dysgonomonas sp. Marseille-P4677]|uniref:dephospho-CoA kinase n=1 Tax=Dysgonomonas sp. Marseille-P4677 TaxID=2364790 RepID=UPI001911824B|nr:dephospho-CoA kinase [Dysgonomonas sp. Marseille-P4677]MBK5722849.1 dephospho-CoA kinase [Dysgonomonas sp. Marseille-P4677]